MEAPKFQIIEGSWISSPEWLNLPRTITGRSPFDRNALVEFRVCQSDVVKAAENRRREPAYEFWSILAGQLPPVPSANQLVEYGDQDLSKLIDAHACFQGVKRPCAEDGNGSQIVAFILKPKSFFAFDARPPVLRMNKKIVDKDLVFVVYARLDEPCDAGPHMGILISWEFVEADDNDQSLPHDYANRFVNRVW